MRTRSTFNPRIPLDFDAKIRLQVTDSVRLVKEFGIDWYRVNVGPVFLRYIRDAVKKRGMNETAITAKAADEIDNEVTDAMKAYLTASSLPIRLVDVTLGKANPPDALLGSLLNPDADETAIRSWIDFEIGKVFPTAKVLIQKMTLDDRYKDVTFETLNRPDFLASVKQAFPRVDWDKAYNEFKAVGERGPQ